MWTAAVSAAASRGRTIPGTDKRKFMYRLAPCRLVHLYFKFFHRRSAEKEGKEPVRGNEPGQNGTAAYVPSSKKKGSNEKCLQLDFWSFWFSPSLC